MATYRIIRGYQRDDCPSETIKTGLTLKQAQRHCHDKETSSSTCTTEEGLLRTRTRGPWFDGYTEE